MKYVSFLFNLQFDMNEKEKSQINYQAIKKQKLVLISNLVEMDYCRENFFSIFIIKGTVTHIILYIF